METTNTIKGIEVIAYKGMKYDMTCKDFKYELGKSYKTDKVELREIGFHACLNPLNILYPRYASSRYFKVKLSGEITKCDFDDTKVAATEITILEEIPSDKFLTNIEWWKNDNVLDLLYFSDGFARVQRTNGDWNFIDKEWNYLSEKWFEWVGDFYDGFAVVKRANDEYNYIDKNGKILSNEWFKWADYFHNGIARVQRFDDLMNLINKEGKILLNEWFRYVDYFKEGFAVVRRADDKYNYIDKNGKILSEEWFNYGFDFKDGLALVERINGESCKIDKTGKIVVSK